MGELTEIAEDLRRKNGCPTCHSPNTPAATHVERERVVHRGTDGSGFYVPASVLSDSATLERYHAVDPNLGAPFIRGACLSGPMHIRAGRAACTPSPDGREAVPRATLDLRRALAAGDPHARAVCRSRQFLFAHLDARGQRRFADVARACSPAARAAPDAGSTSGSHGAGVSGR